jgi:hypothetical protein
MIVWILIVISLALIALITTIGNLIVLFAFYYDKKLRTTNGNFISYFNNQSFFLLKIIL